MQGDQAEKASERVGKAKRAPRPGEPEREGEAIRPGEHELEQEGVRTPTGRIPAARALVEALRREGVPFVFGYPGGQAIQLFDELDAAGMPIVLARHEQGALHEADGYARASGRPGVAVLTSGPGAANAVSGIATAYMDSSPLVVITGQVPMRVIGTDAFQESDTFGITLPVVKHSYLVRDAQSIPRIVREAFHVAATGRPGPVLIDLPSDVAAEPIEPRFLAGEPDMPSYRPTVRGNSRQVKQAASLLAAARRPLILAGGGVVSSGASELLLEAAALLGAPIATTLLAKGAVPAGHPLDLGPIGMHGGRGAKAALAEADALLIVGSRLTDRVTGPLEGFAPQARVVHVDVDPAEIGKVLPVDVPIVGDAREVLAALVARLRAAPPIATPDLAAASPARSPWPARARELRDSLPLRDEAPRAGEGAIDPIELLGALSRALARVEQGEGRPTILSTDVGQH